jgi:N-acetylglucosamine-6-sulfatase
MATTLCWIQVRPPLRNRRRRIDQAGTYQYWNTTLVHTGEEPKGYPGLYATDLLANKSLDWIYHAAQQDAPFFAAINPVNPHGALNWATGKFMPPPPAQRHEGLFLDARVPRGNSFNPDVVGAISTFDRSES